VTARSRQESVVADLIVILTEQALGADDAKRITDLHAGEDLRYYVLVPADTERNLLVDVIDHLSMLELRQALDAVRGREPSADQARTSATEELADSLEALRSNGIEADGEVTQDDPLPAVQQAIDAHHAREVVVVTRPHAMEDTFHRDWASRARDELGVPVLHVYAGTTFLG
jgi:hypothetical protein